MRPWATEVRLASLTQERDQEAEVPHLLSVRFFSELGRSGEVPTDLHSRCLHSQAYKQSSAFITLGAGSFQSFPGGQGLDLHNLVLCSSQAAKAPGDPGAGGGGGHQRVSWLPAAACSPGP